MLYIEIPSKLKNKIAFNFIKEISLKISTFNFIRKIPLKFIQLAFNFTKEIPLKFCRKKKWSLKFCLKNTI